MKDRGRRKRRRPAEVVAKLRQADEALARVGVRPPVTAPAEGARRVAADPRVRQQPAEDLLPVRRPGGAGRSRSPAIRSRRSLT